MSRKGEDPPEVPGAGSFGDIDRIIHEPARLKIMTQLYVTEAADATFLVRQTGLTWGNLSTHLTRLENAGYVEVEKEFRDRKPHTMIGLTPRGRAAFRQYRDNMQRALEELPD